MEVETSLGKITRLNRTSAKPGVSREYTNKKNVFTAIAEGTSLVILYFSGEVYGQDKDYFRRFYDNSKKVFAGEYVSGKKISPKLLGFNDETMTLLVEKALKDLESYLESSQVQEIEKIIDKFIDFIYTVWSYTQEKSTEFCRFLKDKKVENYLKDPGTLDLYKKTQRELTEYIREIDEAGFERGFGFSDVKPANLVEDKEGNILFIDVEKPGHCHWLSMLGQFYQGAVEKASSSLFVKILKEKTKDILSKESNGRLAEQLFTIGRMNRLLIPCTLRNIVFTQEIGEQPDEKSLERDLETVGKMIKTESLDEVLS